MNYMTIKGIPLKQLDTITYEVFYKDLGLSRFQELPNTGFTKKHRGNVYVFESEDVQRDFPKMLEKLKSIPTIINTSDIIHF